MDFSKIKTFEDCENAILGLESIGVEVPEELLELKRQLSNSIQSIYSHLKTVRGYNEDMDKCINDTVQNLWNGKIKNPSDPGLLLGKIQCGKTRTFVGVMGLSFDNGVDVIIVLTKSDDGLVNQTKSRMEYEFDYFLDPVYRNIPKINVSTVNETNFSSHQVNNEKHIFICHKNTNRLSRLKEILSGPFARKKVLIIDDEADFVSRTFYSEYQNIEIGQVAICIDELIKVCDDVRYLQVTATPYSLLLQPDHMVKINNHNVLPFRPRFTTLVPLHSDYVGGKHYFVRSKDSDSMYSHLFQRIDEECMDHLLTANKDKRVYGNVATTPKFKGLRDAIMKYMVGSAIRIIQERKANRNYNTSFFMHVSTTKGDHAYQKDIVENILSIWRQNVIDNKFSTMESCFEEAFEDMKESNKKANAQREIQKPLPSKQEVKNELQNIFRQQKYGVIVVNSSINTTDLLGKDGQLKLTNPLNFFIGGFKLDRGITIDHLIGFFYGRNPQQRQADTVLQHHRMYGNRSKEDMAVTRLYTTQRLYDTMQWIDEMDHQLREVFVNALPDQPEIVTIQSKPDNDIRPCNRAHLLLSELESFSSFKRITPHGFQTGSQTTISPIIHQIDTTIASYQGYGTGKPFLMKVSDAVRIIKQIRTTYIYNRDIDKNEGMEWDEDTMIAAIKATAPGDNLIWCYNVTGRRMSRIRKNGGFVDAPDDGRTDTPIAQQYATDRPILMLLKEDGRKEDGWRNAKFYWPVLRLPINTKTQMYCKN